MKMFQSDLCSTACFSGTFAWDGKYFYFAGNGTMQNTATYQAYDAQGQLVGSYSVQDGGGVNGTYFDWSVGRYATHSGYGSRGGGTQYTWAGGGFTDDSQVYSAVSAQHGI